MIGEQIGLGVGGIIVGAVQTPDNPRQYVVIIEQTESKYIVATIKIGLDGSLPKEWDAGRHDLCFSRAVQVMAERILGRIPQLWA